MALNFVKFQRGTQAQYDRLKLAGRLESDALYFIYDSTAPEDGGLLYLGEVLIGGTGAAAVTQLNDLSDVHFGDVSLSDGMILQYNQNTGKWQPRSIKTAVEQSGANMGAPDLPIVASTTKAEQETVAHAIAGVDPEPLEGDIVFVSGIPYIFDGSSWILLTGTSLEDRIASLESTTGALQTTVNNLSSALGSVQTQVSTIDSRIAAAVDGANHLTYLVQNTLPTVTPENVGSLQKTVFLIPNGETEGNNQYDEYMYVSGNYEKLGSWGADLSGYVTTSTFESRVGNLEAEMANLPSRLAPYLTIATYQSEVGSLSALATAVEKQNTTVVQEIIELNSRLQWQELEELDPNSGD